MAEVIASILTESVSGLLRRARNAAMAGADWIEVRLDVLPPATDPGDVLPAIDLPVLIACRTPRDGGRYEGSTEDRRALIQRWVDAGVEGLDLEDWETFVPANPEGLRLMMQQAHRHGS